MTSLRARLMDHATPLLRRWGLAGMRFLSPEAQARWMTTLFLLHEALILGVVYDFAREAAANRSGWRAAVPRSWRIKGHMLAYCWRSHRDGVVIDGILRRVRTANGEPVDIAALKSRLKARQRTSGPHIFPAWMLAEMQALSDVEPLLAPTADRLGEFHIYSSSSDPAPGRVYAGLWLQIRPMRPDVVVVVPWLKRGGADKGILQFLEHYHRRFGNVLCITTFNAPSPWKSRVPHGVRLVEAGRSLARLEPADRRIVVARLLLQLKPRLIHVIQSEIGWEVIEAHGRALRSQGAILFGSLFADELDAQGAVIGYPIRYATPCRPVLNRLLCDTARFCRVLVNRHGYSDSTVLPVYFWQDSALVKQQPRSDRGRRFLWAARFCVSKRPELLIEIAKLASDIQIDVWGEVDKDSVAAARKLKRLPNVRMYGAYESFADIAAQGGYDGYLYTTISDGMPNVLLEAAAAGLPIVAPAGIGGIGEMVTDATGYPVRNGNSPEEYVQAMRRILDNAVAAESRVTAARELLEAHHSQAAFDRSLQVILDSVLTAGGEASAAPASVA